MNHQEKEEFKGNSSAEATKLRIRVTTEAINFLNQAILEPHHHEVKQICSLWKSYPPELESMNKLSQHQRGNNSNNEGDGVSFEEVLKEVLSKRKSLDMNKYVEKTLS